MTAFEKMLQLYTDADREQLLAVARKSAAKLLPTCKKIDTENDGFAMLSAIILSAIGADGILTLKEKAFICDALDITEETVSNYIKLYDEKMVALADKFADTMDTDTKVETVKLIAAIAASDKTISPRETALLAKILA